MINLRSRLETEAPRFRGLLSAVIAYENALGRGAHTRKSFEERMGEYACKREKKARREQRNLLTGKHFTMNFRLLFVAEPGLRILVYTGAVRGIE